MSNKLNVMQFNYNYEHSFTLAILALTMPTFHFQGFEFAFSVWFIANG